MFVIARAAAVVRSFAFATLLFASPFFLRSAMAQVQQAAFSGLKGAEVTTLVRIGDTGFLPSLASPYPVNTLAYPDGQLIYRIEWGLARGEATRVNKAFEAGTPLEIGSVDFKDDRLEFKVTGRNRDSGRLKIMLGAGWQQKMSNDAVLAVVQRFLQLPSVSSPQTASSEKRVSTGEMSSSKQLVSTAPSPSLPPVRYARPDKPEVSVERVDEKEVQTVLDSLQQLRQEKMSQVATETSATVQALRSFQNAYRSRPNVPAAQEAALLASTLANGSLPSSEAEVEHVRRVLSQCIRIAVLNDVQDGTGRSMGPGASDPIFRSAFLRGDAGSAQLRAADTLRNAVLAENSTTNVQDKILGTEAALDKGELQTAVDGYAALHKAVDPTLPVLDEYLKASHRVEIDVTTLARLKTLPPFGIESVVTATHRIEKTEDAFSRSAGLAMTHAWLADLIASDKVSLLQAVENLPAITVDPRFTRVAQQGASPSSVVNDARESQTLKTSVDELNAAIARGDDLDKFSKDEAAQRSIQNWFGQPVFAQIQAKLEQLSKARAVVATLGTELKAVDSRKNERDELAFQMVSTGLAILKSRRNSSKPRSLATRWRRRSSVRSLRLN